MASAPGNWDTTDNGWTTQNAAGRPPVLHLNNVIPADFLASELPNASVQAAAGTSQSAWLAASGNPANVPQVGSRTPAAPALTFSTASQKAYGASGRVMATVTLTAGYPAAQVSFNWGDSSTPTLRPFGPFAADHKYAADGTYTVTATAVNGTASTPATRTVTVTGGTPVWS